jgi:hypothetical protein
MTKLGVDVFELPAEKWFKELDHPDTMLPNI